MNPARLWLHLTGLNFRLLLQDPQLVFWNYGFFLILIALFVGLFGRVDPSVRATLVAGVVTISVMAIALFSVGAGMSAARARGVYRRYAMTPVSAVVVLSAALAARWLVVVTSAAVQLAVSRVVFDVMWPGGAMGWVATVGAGAAAFAGLGFVVAGIARAGHVANAWVNAVFIPSMALSGAVLPVELLPAPWLRLAHALPGWLVVDGLYGALLRGDAVATAGSALPALAGWAIVTLALGAYVWRRRGWH